MLKAALMQRALAKEKIGDREGSEADRQRALLLGNLEYKGRVANNGGLCRGEIFFARWVSGAS